MTSGVLAAWQSALGAEYRAVFGYGLLGPWLASSRAELARSAQVAHADLRDAAVAALLAAGVTPADPESDYPLATPSGDHAAVTLASSIEEECAAAWRFLYAQAAASTGAASRQARRAAQQALTASAVRATRWRLALDPRTATTPFPGI